MAKLTPEERQELHEINRAIAAEAAELRRRGWPKVKACLGCGELRQAANPADRFHERCYRLAANGSEPVGWKSILHKLRQLRESDRPAWRTRTVRPPRSGRPRVHGHTGSPTYSSWQGLKARRQRVAVDPRWMSFEHFLEDMGARPPGARLRRLNLAEGFKKANCAWWPGLAGSAK